MGNKKFKIAIIGSGHVGLITGVVFADYGNYVICCDNDEEKINKLKNNIMPFYEPHLEMLVKKNVKLKRLTFTSSIKEAVKDSQIIFICVGTPPKEDGEANLIYVEKVSEEIARNMNSYKIIVEKSTVPVETGDWVKKTIKKFINPNVKFDVVSNPEFLREGSAIKDAKKPERIIVGVESKKAKRIMQQLYAPFRSKILFCDIRTAELIKHASNAFLSTKISFINAIANICEKVNADVRKVAEGIGLDKRIGKEFLSAGIGYGGFCFPKDAEAFIRIAEKHGYEFKLLKEVQNINNKQRELFVEKIKKHLWNLDSKIIAILGLSFKPNTDDMRFAPAIDIIKLLQKEGATIRAYDPAAINEAKKIFDNVIYCEDAYEVVKGADCLVLLTEWHQFKHLNFKKIKELMKAPIIFDGRNFLDKEKLTQLGFNYFGVGIP